MVEPTRLNLARRLGGLSSREVASRVGVSPSLVTLWERGDREVGGHLRTLAEVLEQPVEFFLGPPVSVTSAAHVSFRKRSDTRKAVRDEAAATIDFVASVLEPVIATHFDKLPAHCVPNLAEFSPSVAAEILRCEWNLEDAPLRNVVHQLEARGVRVFWTTSKERSLSAFCKWMSTGPFMVLTDCQGDGCRSRFNACHELGHLVLHQDIDFDCVEDPRKLEREADEFASAFLLPSESFLEDCPRVVDFEELLELKVDWGVSVQAMIRRMYDLQVISRWQYESAFKEMSMRGWRSRPEPKAWELEQSQIHWVLADKMEEADRSPLDLADEAKASREIVSRLMPVLRLRAERRKLTDLDSKPTWLELDFDFDNL